MPELSEPVSLDLYLDRVLSEQDQILFREAAKAAQVSAFRAAYVMVWLSCAESLKRKFIELAPRDGNAGRVVGGIQRRESTHQAVDKYILEQAKKYGLLTETEFTRLEHVYTMRCVYGHPYEEQPTAEELVAAASTVVDVVLSQPTKLRHGYLQDQVHLLTERRAFLDDLFEAVERYADLIQTKADDSLHLWFLRKLWDKLQSIAIDPSMAVFLRRGIWFSIVYLRRTREIFDDWGVVEDLIQYPAVLSQVLSDQELFNRIGDSAQDMVVGFLLDESALDSGYLERLKDLASKDLLNGRQRERLAEFIREIPLEYLASSGIHPSYYADRIIEELKSRNWYVQNPAIKVLKNVGAERIGWISSGVQQRLGNNVLQAAEGSAREARSFLRAISNSEDPWPDDFIEGIITECFVNDDNEIRFKAECLYQALRCMRTIGEASRTAIIGRLVNRIQNGTWKHGWGPLHHKGKQESLEILEKVIGEDEIIFGVVKPLIEIVQGLETEEENGVQSF
jgi:hypothetical protein